MKIVTSYIIVFQNKDKINGRSVSFNLMKELFRIIVGIILEY